MTRTEWLESLKEGDRVAISARYGRGYLGIFRVTRTTKTLIIVKSEGTYEYRFRRLDGDEQARGYGAISIYQVTLEIEDKLLRADLLKKVSDSKTISKLKTDTLKQIYEIMTNENNKTG